MNMRIVIFILALVMMLVAGCTQPAPVQPAATPVATPLPTAPPATVATPLLTPTTGSVSPTIRNAVSDYTIHISKTGFDPAKITVQNGSTVRWVNEDSTTDPALYNPTHRIKLVNIKDSPLLSSGQGWSWIFSEPGSYDFSDMIHTVPTGTVTVV
jgi:plastocyanin